MNAATHVLKCFDIIEPDRNKLRRFVGPPLKDSFRDFYRITDGDKAVSVFRDYYVEKGFAENEIYPGMRELLKKLHEEEKVLIISSSKLEAMIIKVLNYFGVLEYFDIIVGATLDESRSEKSDIIRESFNFLKKREKKLTLNEIKDLSVMIGDRIFDVNGARENGIDCIGVTYGYGSREELSGASKIVDSVSELENILI
jgi:phosphoglycolate phosphatase